MLLSPDTRSANKGADTPGHALKSKTIAFLFIIWTVNMSDFIKQSIITKI